MIMNNVVITTDSASDLNDLFIQRSIYTLPLYVNLGDDVYEDGKNIDSNKIFDFVEKNKILPKTAARSNEDFKNFFKQFTDMGDSVVYISISSKISSTYQNAALAASELKNVYTIDGLSLSSGTGLLALFAADLRDQGLDAKTIYEKTLEKVNCVQASFVVDTMEYLYKGGRCNGLTNFVASLLKIHPSLQLIDGYIKVRSKYLGNIKKCINKYVTDILHAHNKPIKNRVFITHSVSTPEIIQSVKDQLLNFGFEENNIFITTASSTITSHCGKGTLGILYINETPIF